jgi:tetratricopeptide (TPR) repeat protein
MDNTFFNESFNNDGQFEESNLSGRDSEFYCFSDQNNSEPSLGDNLLALSLNFRVKAMQKHMAMARYFFSLALEQDDSHNFEEAEENYFQAIKHVSEIWDSENTREILEFRAKVAHQLSLHYLERASSIASHEELQVARQVYWRNTLSYMKAAINDMEKSLELQEEELSAAKEFGSTNLDTTLWAKSLIANQESLCIGFHVLSFVTSLLGVQSDAQLYKARALEIAELIKAQSFFLSVPVDLNKLNNIADAA